MNDFSKKEDKNDQKSNKKEKKKKRNKLLYKTTKVSFRATTKTTLLLY